MAGGGGSVTLAISTLDRGASPCERFLAFVRHCSPVHIMPSDLPQLCVVVPCYNEQESLPALVDNLTPALEQATGGSWRVLFVDDGSTDDTPQFIWELNAREPRFGGVRLSRNFGHQPAVATALRFASGQSVGIIDCDLQDPPEVLIELFTKVRDGQCDVCSGQRVERDEVPGWLHFCYKGFYRLMAAMAEHPFMLDAGDFCVFNRRVHLALLSLPEIMQVQRGLRSWVGFRQASLSYRRPPRHGGSSKYNFSRLVRLALDNVVNFTTLPLRLASWLGFFMIILIGLAMVFFWSIDSCRRSPRSGIASGKTLERPLWSCISRSSPPPSSSASASWASTSRCSSAK